MTSIQPKPRSLLRRAMNGLLVMPGILFLLLAATRNDIAWKIRVRRSKRLKRPLDEMSAAYLRWQMEMTLHQLIADKALSSRGNDITGIFEKMIPRGSTCDDAERLLRAAEFAVAPRPAASPPGNRPDRHNMVAYIRGYAHPGLSSVSIYVHLTPFAPGNYDKIADLSADIIITHL